MEKDLWRLRGCLSMRVPSGEGIRRRLKGLQRYRGGKKILHMGHCPTIPRVFHQSCSRQTCRISCNDVPFRWKERYGESPFNLRMSQIKHYPYFSSPFITLPAGFRGRVSLNSTNFGTLYLARRRPQNP
jgi:hypothetical protein